MKSWLSQHPDSVPSGMHPTASTSRQLLSGLRNLGWKYEETSSEVRLFPPNEIINTQVISAVFGPENNDSQSEDEQGFGLERQLRDFLSDNIESITINGKKLKLYVDQTGRDGVEYSTGVGFIDVLGIDDNENFYVFELKRDNGSDKVIGQVARYMGWVKNTIGAGKVVYGIVVAKSVNEKLRYAASVRNNVYLYEYKAQFFLNEANEIGG
jgi:hypothetical protein